MRVAVIVDELVEWRVDLIEVDFEAVYVDEEVKVDVADVDVADVEVDSTVVTFPFSRVFVQYTVLYCGDAFVELLTIVADGSTATDDSLLASLD